MFEEPITQGPGANGAVSYVFEIAIILLVAFILGYLLRWLLNGRYRSIINDLNNQILLAKNESFQVENTVKVDITPYERQISYNQEEIKSLKERLSACVSEKFKYLNEIDALKRELSKKEIANNSMKIDHDDLGSEETQAINDIRNTSPATVEEVITAELPIVKGAEMEVGALTYGNSESIPDASLELNKTAEELETTKAPEIVGGTETSAPKINESEEVTETIERNTKLSSDSSTRSLEPDNLRRIEGIGPKIEQMLNAEAIFTFAHLRNTAVNKLKAILSEAGPTYAVHDPTTWPEQAGLAHEGRWQELDLLQEKLKGGRRKK